MALSTWPDISHLSVSRPELINVLWQMGQQVKWPQKMKEPESFQNPGFWCDFHRDHGHKTEECVALKIEVNELLKKGHLREFLFEKAKSHLSKEKMGKPTEATPVSPPRQDRVNHVISGGYLRVNPISLSRTCVSNQAAIETSASIIGSPEALCGSSTAISAFKRGLLPDGDLYKELTKYQCKTMEDVLSRAWTQVNWEEDVASSAKAQQKQDPKTIPEPADREGRRDGSVHVAGHLSPLCLKAGADQCSEADGPTDHSERKDQGPIAITELASGSSHRGTGGRGDCGNRNSHCRFLF
ncbi:hypothetical protein DY000_02049155 [Brassica cretica]|uniref:Uncharacterized protein n=1 Tax=Brassica cretica TaxID=69181 RepID=A0ABQ7EV64_BRACR|nr:hypothetical protein DY000_02049155 [Brassica cretica]